MRFSGAENLYGGPDEDLFVFGLNGSLEGVIAGGPGEDALRAGADPDT